MCYRLLSILVFLAGCFHAALCQKFTLYGYVEHLPDTVLYLAYNKADGGEVTFETESHNGRFIFSGNIEEPTAAQIYSADEEYQDFLFVDSGVAYLYGNTQIPKMRILSGNPTAKEYQDYTNVVSEVNLKKNMLLKNNRPLLYGGDTAINNPLWRQFAEYSRQYDSVVEDWILSHTNSYVAAMLCYYQFNDESKINKGDSITHLFSAHIQKSKYVNQIRELKSNYAKLALGQPAPLFQLPDTSGKNVSLQQFRGKVTLLDFWGSWCGPCRANNPGLKKIYEQYHDKGFEILGIALETDRQAWLSAIKKDELPWINTMAMNGWNHPVALSYAVTAVPTAYLLDAEGKIVAKNVYVHQLPNLLNEKLKK